MPCPFSARRAITKTAAITEPAGPRVVFYARIATDGGQQSLDDQYAQTLAYPAAHHPAYLLLDDDSSEPARARFPLPSMWRRAFQRHRRHA
ncbi:hypothetical protein [Protofrankia symbiont of Coriaria ruscifolia]|uniref:hypothetical protein n=1 Tax=Protofrankia symbiont of Coriaria ruscifolia TaxID=1306542 RepID=UPI00104116F0|nr:hypothetical protein [Protofrankia symbiont of Coriaria ruscifolia]